MDNNVNKPRSMSSLQLPTPLVSSELIADIAAMAPPGSVADVLAFHQSVSMVDVVAFDPYGAIADIAFVPSGDVVAF